MSTATTFPHAPHKAIILHVLERLICWVCTRVQLCGVRSSRDIAVGRLRCREYGKGHVCRQAVCICWGDLRSWVFHLAPSNSGASLSSRSLPSSHHGHGVPLPNISSILGSLLDDPLGYHIIRSGNANDVSQYAGGLDPFQDSAVSSCCDSCNLLHIFVRHEVISIGSKSHIFSSCAIRRLWPRMLFAIGIYFFCLLPIYAYSFKQVTLSPFTWLSGLCLCGIAMCVVLGLDIVMLYLIGFLL